MQGGFDITKLDHYVGKDGNDVKFDTRADLYAVHFSASWWGACKGFKKVTVAAYDAFKKTEIG